MAHQNYSSGVWQFEGYAFVPSGTTGVSIMQVFGAAKHATTLMLHVYGGALVYYNDWTRVVDRGIYNRVVAVSGGKIVDYDVNVALSMHKTIDDSEIEVANSISI